MIFPYNFNWNSPLRWENERFLEDLDVRMRSKWKLGKLDFTTPSPIIAITIANGDLFRKAQLRHLPLPLAAMLTQYRGEGTMSQATENRLYRTLDELRSKADALNGEGWNRHWIYNHTTYGPMGTAQWLRNYTAEDIGEQAYHDFLSWRMDCWELEVYNIYPQYDLLVRILSTIHIDEENPRVVSWYEDDPQKDLYAECKVKSMRWTKFLQMLRRKFGFRFTDQEIETASTWVGDNLKAPKFVFHEVSGKKIRQTYDERYFNSCMHNNDGTRFYDYQDNVSLLRIEDDKGKLVGRALIWDGEALVRGQEWTKRKLLDRIYPSDGGPHVKAAIRYAKENGWLYKTSQSIDGSMSETCDYHVVVNTADYYPYMDTLAWPDDDEPSGTFRLTNYASCPEELELRYTDGRDVFNESADRSICEICGDRDYTDDMRWVEHAGGMVCENCMDREYTYSEIEEDYVPNEDSVVIANLTTNWGGTVTCDVANYGITYSEADDAYYWTDTAPSYLRLTQELIEVTAGDYDGEMTILDNVIIDNTDDGEELIWHVNDTGSRDAYILEQRREAASYMSKEG